MPGDGQSSGPFYCGDCGAPTPDHWPDCPTLQERAAGVEVTSSFSNQAPRRCPKCGSAMTRNHDRQSNTWTDNCTGGVCGVTLEAKGPLCAGADPTCPCQDGDVCNYVDDPVTGTPAMSPMSPAAGFDAIAAMPGAQVFEVPYPGEGEVCPGCGKVVIPEHALTVQYGDRFYHLEPCWKEAKEKL